MHVHGKLSRSRRQYGNDLRNFNDMINAFDLFHKNFHDLSKEIDTFYQSLSKLDFDTINDKLALINLTASYLSQFFTLLYKFSILVLAYSEIQKESWKNAISMLKKIKGRLVSFKRISMSDTLLEILSELRNLALNEKTDQQLKKLLDDLLLINLVANISDSVEMRNKVLHDTDYLLKNPAHIDKYYEKAYHMLLQLSIATKLMQDILKRVNELISSNPRYAAFSRFKSRIIISY
jgi:hypothetical protein